METARAREQVLLLSVPGAIKGNHRAPFFSSAVVSVVYGCGAMSMMCFQSNATVRLIPRFECLEGLGRRQSR